MRRLGFTSSSPEARPRSVGPATRGRRHHDLGPAGLTGSTDAGVRVRVRSGITAAFDRVGFAVTDALVASSPVSPSARGP